LSDLPHKTEILLKALDAPLSLTIIIIIIKLHPRLTDLLTGTDAETGHAPTVQVQRAHGEEIQKQAVVGFFGVGDVSGVGGVVVDFVEGGWVFDAEGAVGVLAVEAFLVAVDHGFPVEAAGVGDGAAVGEAAEVVVGE
jgi:hypothetical protein